VSSQELSFYKTPKTPFLLGISSIPHKPWSNSSIPSVDVFTSPLWSCLQNLVRFGLDLATQSSSFQKNAGWKNRFWARAEFFLSPDEPTFWKYPRRINQWVGFSCVRVLLLSRCTDEFFLSPIGLTGEWFCVLCYSARRLNRRCTPYARRFNRWTLSRFAVPLDNCTGDWIWIYRIIRCWTSVEPTLLKPLHRVNRC